MARIYTPPLRPFLVTVLYHEARRRSVPMTRLANELVEAALTGTPGWQRAEQQWHRASAQEAPDCRQRNHNPAVNHNRNTPNRKELPTMITLECNYSKKIGLPQYSSHQFCVTLRTELAEASQVQAESDRLYRLLQASVDTALKEVGWLPEAPAPGNGRHPGNGNGHGNGHDEPWQCSPKQQNLILKIVREQQLEKNAVEALAQDRFGKSVKGLNKLEASGLIEELFEQTGQGQRNRRFNLKTKPA